MGEQKSYPKRDRRYEYFEEDKNKSNVNAKAIIICHNRQEYMKTQSQIESAYNEGRYLYSSFNKNITATMAVGVSQDLSGLSGNPIAQYYLGAAGTSTGLYRSTDWGLNHGGNVDTKKYLHTMLLNTVSAMTPITVRLFDYLMFYPFIGMDTGLQNLTNTITLPRYEAREGVQMMIVEQNPYTGGAQVQVGYTNQDGVSGRLTPIIRLNSQTSIGTIASSERVTSGVSGNFLALQGNDYGVQSVETIEFITGDTGVCAIVLVKPIASFAIFETTAPCLYDLWFEMGVLPEIRNDAYLNFVVTPSANLTGAATNTIFGEMTVIWDS